MSNFIALFIFTGARVMSHKGRSCKAMEEFLYDISLKKLYISQALAKPLPNAPIHIYLFSITIFGFKMSFIDD
jgi:hypothetical protein